MHNKRTGSIPAIELEPINAKASVIHHMKVAEVQSAASGSNEATTAKPGSKQQPNLQDERFVLRNLRVIQLQNTSYREF